jgi:hypothetical protein
MATGVWSWDTTAANNANADSTINWAEGQDPSTVNNSARAEMAGMAKYLLDAHGALATTGAANTYSVTTNSSMAALRDGLGLSLVINASSTGASTLNVDGLGAKAIRKITSAGEAAIGTGDMIAAGHYIFDYDESANSVAGAWILLNPTPPAATTYLSDIVEDTTPQLGGMLDVNAFGIGDGTDEILKFTEAATPVNEFTFGNAATGSGPTISATGDDTNIDILLVPKGSGVTKSGGVEVVTLTGTQTVTNKTVDLTDNTLTGTGAEFNTALSDGSFAFLGAAQTFTAFQSGGVEAMSDGATITPTGTKHYHTVTLGGNRTLANPTAITAGGTYVFKITQDGTGSRTLSWGSAYDWGDGTAPTLTTTASGVDCFSGFSADGTTIQMTTIGQAFS